MGKINKNNSAEKAYDRDTFLLEMMSFDGACDERGNLVPGMDYDPEEWDESLALYDALIEDRILAGADWSEIAQLRREKKACEVEKRRAKAAHFALTETKLSAKEIAYI